MGVPVLKSEESHARHRGPRPQSGLSAGPHHFGAARVRAALPGGRAGDRRGVQALRLRELGGARRGRAPRRGRDGESPHPGAAGHRPARLRAPPEGEGPLLAVQHLRARRLDLSVLRAEVPSRRAEPRPRDPALARGLDQLGQRRLFLRPLQSQEGRALPRAGRDAAPARPRASPLDADVPQRHPPRLLPGVAAVPVARRRGVLERRAPRLSRGVGRSGRPELASPAVPGAPGRAPFGPSPWIGLGSHRGRRPDPQARTHGPGGAGAAPGRSAAAGCAARDLDRRRQGRDRQEPHLREPRHRARPPREAGRPRRRGPRRREPAHDARHRPAAPDALRLHRAQGAADRGHRDADRHREPRPRLGRARPPRRGEPEVRPEDALPSPRPADGRRLRDPRPRRGHAHERPRLLPRLRSRHPRPRAGADGGGERVPFREGRVLAAAAERRIGVRLRPVAESGDGRRDVQEPGGARRDPLRARCRRGPQPREAPRRVPPAARREPGAHRPGRGDRPGGRVCVAQVLRAGDGPARHDLLRRRDVALDPRAPPDPPRAPRRLLRAGVRGDRGLAARPRLGRADRGGCVKRLTEQTLYEILEVAPDATPAAIEVAVEKIRVLYGPGSLATYTLMSPDEAEQLATRVDEARRTLLDPERRAAYDDTISPRAEEVRTAAIGGNGATPVPPFGPLPPVIPAVALESSPTAEPRAADRPATAASGNGEARPAATPPPVPPSAPAPIRLDREVPATPAPPEIPMPEGSAWTGEALRKVREARGISVPQIAERTKVTRHHVENIENERYAALPAPVYLRGILLSLARELRLDGQKVSRAYLERAAAAGYGGGQTR